MNHLIPRVVPALALCLAGLGAAHAQAGSGAPASTGVALPYRSVFADYVPWQDTRPGDWRALNDAVKGDSMSGMDPSGTKGPGNLKGMPGSGGMAAHAGMPAASTPAVPNAPGHGGHDGNGGHR